MGKRRRTFLVPAVLLLLAAIGFLYFAFRFSGSDFTAFKGFFLPVRTSSSWSILEEIRDLEELETASYDMKVVFPFDFIGDDEVDWEELKVLYDWSPGQFLQKTDPLWHPGGVLPANYKYAELYALCREAGIDPGKPDRRFLVMSVSVHAGIDLHTWLGSFTAGDPEEEVGGIEVTVSEDGTRSLSLTAPPIGISSFIVEDRDSTAEGFPDIPLSPEEWGTLVSRLEPSLREMALSSGLPERAESGGRAFLVEIFEAAGYDHVSFIES